MVVFSLGHMVTDVGEAAYVCHCSVISAGRDKQLPNFLSGTCSDPQWGIYMSGGVQQGRGKWPVFGPEKSMNHATLKGGWRTLACSSWHFLLDCSAAENSCQHSTVINS